jgi:hypothetical protein
MAILVGLCALLGPIALAWLDTRLIDRNRPRAVWALAIAWLLPWETAWVTVLRGAAPTEPHAVSQLVAHGGAVHLFLPVLLAFGLPASTVAIIALDRDDEGRRSSVLRSSIYGVIVALVTIPIAIYAALSAACAMGSCL